MQRINCLNCGSPTEPNQQFCRSCGASLVLAEPTAPNRSVLWGLISAFVGIAIALVGKMLLQQEIVTLIGVLMSITGMFWIAATPFLRPSRPRRSETVHTPQPEPLAAAPTTKKLTPVKDIDFISSVTEGTTDLLKVPAPGRSDTHR